MPAWVSVATPENLHWRFSKPPALPIVLLSQELRFSTLCTKCSGCKGHFRGGGHPQGCLGFRKARMGRSHNGASRQDALLNGAVPT